MKYSVLLHEDANSNLMGLDNSIRSVLIKRIARMREEPPGRHMESGLGYFVIRMGQYRIVYACGEKELQKTIYFVGDHKEYENWYSQQMRG